MKIFDEQGNIIENPDLEKGKLLNETRPIIHRYTITQEEQSHYETIKEYANGGKDVELVIDIPEEGHWVTYDADGNEIEFEGFIPEDAPHENDISDFEEFLRYVLYTEEELADIANQVTTDEILNALLGTEV